MKKAAVTLSSLAVTLTFLLALVTPAAFAQGGGRGAGGASVGGSGFRGGAFIGGGFTTGAGRSGGIVGGGRGSIFRRPSFHHRHRFHRNFFFGVGTSIFAPAWWWYDPYYYYWAPPAAYYTGYYGYPDYDYYGSPTWSDPCLSSDPAYAPYCSPSSTGYPYGGEHGAPPVDYPYYPSPETQGQPESIGGSTSPAPPEQPTSTGGER